MEKEQQAAVQVTEEAQTVTQQVQASAEQLEAARRAERERTGTIISLCEKHGMTAEFRDELIGNGVELADARARIPGQTWRRQPPQHRSVQVGREERDGTRGSLYGRSSQ